MCGHEIGHQYLGIGKDAPEWEDLASGSGLLKMYGKPSSEIKDPEVWNKCADDFAHGLYNTLLHWSPDRFVLGGSLFISGSLPLPRVRETLRAISRGLPVLPEFAVAMLGEKAGLYGALALWQDAR
jgi:predicted NBD/HSP70 family sugar kinase